MIFPSKIQVISSGFSNSFNTAPKAMKAQYLSFHKVLLSSLLKAY